MALTTNLLWIPLLAWIFWLYRSDPVPAFDVERSIALHNRIVQLGLEALPGNLRSRIKTHANWFEAHNITNIASLRLTAPVVTFLSNITIVEDPDQVSFLPHLQGIPHPIWLRDETVQPVEARFNHYNPSLKHSKGLFMYPSEDDSVLLYKHPDPETYGIAMDLKTHLCAFAIENRPLYVKGNDPEKESVGMPLQHILEEYLWRIQKGKFYVDVTAAGQSITNGGDPVSANGWRIAPWTAYDMDRTVQAWDNLTTTIAQKMGALSQPSLELRDPSGSILGDATTQRLTGFPSFAQVFLERARRPPFSYIAPGLRIPDAAFYISVHASFQEYFNLRENQHMWTFGESPYSSIPLFLAERSGIRFFDRVEERIWHKHGWLEAETPGLYIRGEEGEGDSSHLLLPFGLAVDPRTQRAPGSIKEKSNTALYQQKRCAHGLDRSGAPLYLILQHWTVMVKSGEWSVGKEGVNEKIEKWQDAESVWKEKLYKTDASCRY
jgi:hypothetical protein